jgi:uncharacterized protein YcbX
MIVHAIYYYVNEKKVERLIERLRAYYSTEPEYFSKTDPNRVIVDVRRGAVWAVVVSAKHDSRDAKEWFTGFLSRAAGVEPREVVFSLPEHVRSMEIRKTLHLGFLKIDDF